MCCAERFTIRRRERLAASRDMQGVFSTASDLEKFCAMELNGGAVSAGTSERILSASLDRENDVSAIAAVDSGASRTRLGYRLAVFVASRRAFSHWLVRPYWVHRHFDLDRSRERELRHFADEFRSSLSTSADFQSCAAKSRPPSPPRCTSATIAGRIVKIRAQHSRRPPIRSRRRFRRRAITRRTGIDVLEDEQFAPLRGKRIG